AGKLAKGFLRSNNFDTNSRLCMASAAVGYTRTFGADGPPCSYEDVDAADVFLLIGTNTADCHPVLFKRLRRRKAAAPDDVGVIVADPRWTETADLADLHLALRPGSDVALLNGMLHVLAREGLLDRDFITAHTTGWGAVEREIAAYPPERAAILTGLSPGTIQPEPGRAALEIFEGLTTGEVRAVWILCTNPAASLPDTDLVERALRQADLVIVQDAYHPTETTRFADVLLPAAQWPEKDGVMTNSERRLTYLPKLVDPPGEALPDTAILTRFADEMGWKEAFPCESTSAIFDEFAALTAGTVCDYSGVSHARLRRDGPLQWRVPATDHPGTARLYADGRFPTGDGRAR